MRYKLRTSIDGKNFSDNGIYAKTKSEIDKWIEDNIKLLRLDYRVGYLIKFANNAIIYEWVWTKDNKKVK